MKYTSVSSTFSAMTLVTSAAIFSSNLMAEDQTVAPVVVSEGTAGVLVQREWIYEIIDSVSCESSDGSMLNWRSNSLIVVQTTGSTVTLALRSDIERQRSRADDPLPNHLELEYDEDISEIPLPTALVSMAFEPSEDGLLKVTGVGPYLANRAVGYLSRGPSSSVIRSEALEPYLFPLLANDELSKLAGEQRNGELDIDTTMDDMGVLVGSKNGWELPMQFSFAEQSPAVSVTVSGTTQNLAYSSRRVGPAKGFSIQSRIVSAEWTISRVVELRPLLIEIPAEPAAYTELVIPELGGTGAAWTRTLVLGLLGGQRLLGLRESGLAMWVATVAADGRLDGTVASDPVVRNILLSAATAVASVEPVPLGTVSASDYETLVTERDSAQTELETVQEELNVTQQELDEEQDMDATYLASIVISSLAVDTDDGGADIAAITPRLTLQAGFGSGSWRWGGSLQALRLAVDEGATTQEWDMAGATLRFAYHSDNWEFGVHGGQMAADYSVKAIDRTVDGSLTYTIAGIDFQRRLGSRWSVGVNALTALSGEGTLMLVEPFIDWHLDPRFALRLQGTLADWSATSDTGGRDITTEGSGLGFGIVARW